jgi:hypothetical protein
MSEQALLDEFVRATRDPARSSGELARMAEDVADQIGNVHDLVAVAEAERTPLIVHAVGAPISRCGWGSNELVADVHVVTRYADLALEFPTTQSVGASLGGLLSLTLQHQRYRLSDDEQKVVSELVARALEEWTSELDTYLMNTEALQLLRTLGTRSNIRRLLGDRGLETVGVQLRARREGLVALEFDGVPELLRLWSL